MLASDSHRVMGVSWTGLFLKFTTIFTVLSMLGFKFFHCKLEKLDRLNGDAAFGLQRETQLTGCSLGLVGVSNMFHKIHVLSLYRQDVIDPPVCKVRHTSLGELVLQQSQKGGVEGRLQPTNKDLAKVPKESRCCRLKWRSMLKASSIDPLALYVNLRGPGVGLQWL